MGGPTGSGIPGPQTGRSQFDTTIHCSVSSCSGRILASSVLPFSATRRRSSPRRECWARTCAGGRKRSTGHGLSSSLQLSRLHCDGQARGGRRSRRGRRACRPPNGRECARRRRPCRRTVSQGAPLRAEGTSTKELLSAIDQRCSGSEPFVKRRLGYRDAPSAIFCVWSREPLADGGVQPVWFVPALDALELDVAGGGWAGFQ